MFSIDILTLFPSMIEATLLESIIGRGIRKGHLAIRTHQIREYTLNRQNQVDDYPYGGGMGMVMYADPLFRCLDAVKYQYGSGTVLLMSPRGKVFNQEMAKGFASDSHLILVCGHYEGVDERFIEECVDAEISIGDFVLTGGEIAACAIADSVGRLIPGVLAEESAFEEESHWDGLLEHPQYTRPAVWHNKEVPEVLLSGNHAKISAWKREMSLSMTKEKRPDLWDAFEKKLSSTQ
jgi:tRNA (guanine37-N1)-methyltransferase